MTNARWTLSWMLLCAIAVSCTSKPGLNDRADSPFPNQYEGRPVLRAPRLADLAELRGDLSAPAWGQAKQVTLALPPGGLRAPLASEARVFCSISALYIGFRCEERQMDKLDTTAEEFWARDEVEVFLEPAADTLKRPYHHIFLDAAGHISFERSHIYRRYFDDKALAEPWQPKIDTRVVRTADGWSCEMRIPFDQLKRADEPAGRRGLWRLNLCRVRPGKPDGAFDASWVGFSMPGFQWPAEFGYLVVGSLAKEEVMAEVRRRPPAIDPLVKLSQDRQLEFDLERAMEQLSDPKPEAALQGSARLQELIAKNSSAAVGAIKKLHEAQARHRSDADRSIFFRLREHEYFVGRWVRDDDPPPQETLDRLAAFEPRQFKDAEGHVLNYRLMRPINWNPAKRYPLLLDMHGSRECGSDNIRQLTGGAWQYVREPLRSKYPCFVLVPQCPQGLPWFDGRTNPESAAVMKATSNYRLAEQPNQTAKLMIGLLESLPKEFSSIDSGRLYVTGSSLGGFGTYELLARRPDLFAAASPVCGGGDETKANLFAKVPIWIWHGEKDQNVKVQASRNMFAALKAAGGTPKYTEVPDAPHHIGPRHVIDDVMAWMFQQHK